MLQAKLSSTFPLSIPDAMRPALADKTGQEFTLPAQSGIIALSGAAMNKIIRRTSKSAQDKEQPCNL
ncbi:hypothetical protein GCAAIG_00880 [Candidatus Electronema halotolerans]